MKYNCFLICFLSLGFAAGLKADALILKDGSRVEKSDMKIVNGKISRMIKLPNGASAEGTLDVSQISSLDWGEPEEMSNASALMAQGKTEEAVEQLKLGKVFFEALKSVPGNWYLDIYLAYVDALNQAGKFEEVIKLMPDLKTQSLTDTQKTKLQIMKLDIDRQTSSDYDLIVSQAEDILKQTSDSSVAASIWGIIGDIYMKKKDYERALLSYLRITVFYGSQVQKLPDAEMRAAKALVKMRRYADAQKFFARLIETYPGSAIALSAEKERAAIGGMKNEDQLPLDAAAPAAGATPAPAAPPSESPPAAPAAK
jgi:tetratricopeptide (TPR) repeat protein